MSEIRRVQTELGRKDVIGTAQHFFPIYECHATPLLHSTMTRNAILVEGGTDISIEIGPPRLGSLRPPWPLQTNLDEVQLAPHARESKDQPRHNCECRKVLEKCD